MGLAASEIEKGLLRMEASGTVLRGKFTGTGGTRAGGHAPHIPVELRSIGQRGAGCPHTKRNLHKQIHQINPHVHSPDRLRPNGVSGGCWRGFTG